MKFLDKNTKRLLQATKQDNRNKAIDFASSQRANLEEKLRQEKQVEK